MGEGIGPADAGRGYLLQGIGKDACRYGDRLTGNSSGHLVRLTMMQSCGNVDHGGSMRIVVGILALVTVANATIGPPIEAAATPVITVMFKSVDMSVFGLNSNGLPANDANGPIESLQLIVAMKFYNVPLSDCRSLRDVHVETARFLGFESLNRAEGTFSFTFRMGDEATRKLGQLPRIQISYSKGRLQSETITSGSLTS